jgi:hypothetical protein
MNDGTEFEDHVATRLLAWQTHAPAFFHRYTDTKASRNFVQPAPADFLFALEGAGVFNIECKSSLQKSLAKAWKDDPHHRVQIAKHRMWLRAGQKSLFLFWQIGSNKVQVHKGDKVVEATLAGDRSSYLWDPFMTVPWISNFREWEDVWYADQS